MTFRHGLKVLNALAGLVLMAPESEVLAALVIVWSAAP